MKTPKQIITTSQGSPVEDNQNSITAGERGGIVVSDFHLLDKLAHFNRERIPERVVHAKGAGAFGYFEVTHDITKYCKASVFGKVGGRIPVFMRFSTVGGEKGSADTARDPRGFAVKFFTEEGNWDMVGNNTPVFFVRDPIKFPDFIHTQKRHPKTNLPNHDMFWDFLSLTPESVHQVTILFSDRGTPDGYRHMNGYGSHTFKFENKNKELFYVKFHFKTDQGNKSLTGPQAAQLAATDPDYATRDLFSAIANRRYPSWGLFVQVMGEEEAREYKWDILDVTKVWPQKEYPLLPVGKLVLNRNPDNYFASVEQAAFSPGTLVPGISPSEDKMLQGRIFSYHDAHRYRLGPNYELIPINVPNAQRNDYSIRDGAMCVGTNKGSSPNYEPNSVEGTPKEEPIYKPASRPVSGLLARHPPSHPNDDFAQTRALYTTVMSESDRMNLISNIAGHLKHASQHIQKRQVGVFSRVHPDYGRRVAKAIGLPQSEMSKL